MKSITLTIKRETEKKGSKECYILDEIPLSFSYMLYIFTLPTCQINIHCADSKIKFPLLAA